jgi:LPXTG-motif cell wall-anchored protein
VPEPSSLAIAGIGALGLIGFGLRRRKAMGA